MLICPVCHKAIEEKAVSCPSCYAQKAYFKMHDIVLGKSVFILLGVFVPLMVALFAILAQTLFGLTVAASMVVPILFSLLRLTLGPKWFR